MKEIIQGYGLDEDSIQRAREIASRSRGLETVRFDYCVPSKFLDEARFLDHFLEVDYMLARCKKRYPKNDNQCLFDVTINGKLILLERLGIS